MNETYYCECGEKLSISEYDADGNYANTPEVEEFFRAHMDCAITGDL